MFFACDRVNGGNYWQDSVQRGQIVSQGPRLGRVTPQSAEIIDQCQWRQPGNSPAMTDTRTVTVHVEGPQLRWIDVSIQWNAVEEVTIAKTNHALFAVRAAADLAPLGGGTLENSQGKSGEKGTFGQPAQWCTFYGKRAGLPGDVVEGIVLFDHPANPWNRCPWFTRDYGFISPNPFYFTDKPWRLAAGSSVRLNFRIVAYASTPAAADLHGLFRSWTGS